jgi:tetratricopeptide (TPR) repeat protein
VDNVELVKRFLKAQNLEQVSRIEEAVELYESIVEARFDSSGPYDRLIALYNHQARHRDVMRIADAAIEHVQTYDEKRAFYEKTRLDAKKAIGRLPQAQPRNPQ